MENGTPQALAPLLRGAKSVLSAAGIKTTKFGGCLIQFAPGPIGLYQMVTVEKLPSGELLVGGRDPEHAREVLTEAGFPVLGGSK